MYCQYFLLAKRFDQNFMGAILQILQYGSFIPLAAAIGYAVVSVKSDNPEMRMTAVKLFFTFVFFYILLPAAEAGGFA